MDSRTCRRCLSGVAALAVACAEPAAAPWPAQEHSVAPVDGAPPGALLLDVSPAIVDELMTVDVSGAFPGETVHIAWGAAGLGPGPCPGALGGECFDLAPPMSVLTKVTADLAGEGGIFMVVPDLPGFEACFQPAARRGPGGSDSVVGNAECRTFDYDTDGDGVGDLIDPCPLDPLDDSDGDGTCDSDDLCPDDPTDLCDPVPVLDLVFVQGDAGPITATCPDGTEIAFGFGVQTSTGHAGEACLKANNQACIPGATSCTSGVCDTPGDDEMAIFLACAADPGPYADLDLIHVQGNAGDNTATCAADDVIAFGFSYQWSPDHTGEACLKANNQACAIGDTGCAQSFCDTPGDDESFVYIGCAPPDSPLLESEDIFVQGDAGGNTATCADGTEIAFGWALQASTGHSGDACLKGNNHACAVGDVTCTQSACDTAGDDESMIYAVCRDPS